MIGPHSIHAAARARAVHQARRALQLQTPSTVANDHRRHSQMQPVQTSLRKKARYGYAAPFDKQPRQTPRLQRRDGVRKVQRGVVSHQVADCQHAICADLRDRLVPPARIAQP